MLGLVVEQDETGTPCLPSQIDGLSRGRVSPSCPGLNDLIQVHRIVDQCVSALYKLDKAFTPIGRHLVRSTRPQFVVRDVDEILAARERNQAIP